MVISPRKGYGLKSRIFPTGIDIACLMPLLLDNAFLINIIIFQLVEVFFLKPVRVVLQQLVNNSQLVGYYQPLFQPISGSVHDQKLIASFAEKFTVAA